MAIRRPPEREPHASDCISRRVVSVVNVSSDAAVDLFRHQSWLRFSVFCCYLTVLSTRTCVYQLKLVRVAGLRAVLGNVVSRFKFFH